MVSRVAERAAVVADLALRVNGEARSAAVDTR
jgi:hypothetical protein